MEAALLAFGAKEGEEPKRTGGAEGSLEGNLGGRHFKDMGWAPEVRIRNMKYFPNEFEL